MERNARNNTNYEFYTNIQMRRKKKEKRELVLDAIYDSSLVSKLTNYLMFSGKKSTAQKVIWGALEEIKKASEELATEIQKIGQAVYNKGNDTGSTTTGEDKSGSSEPESPQPGT